LRIGSGRGAHTRTLPRIWACAPARSLRLPAIVQAQKTEAAAKKKIAASAAAYALRKTG